LEQRLGRSATDEEVAKELGIELQTFHSLLDQLNGLTIGHFQVSDGGEDGLDEDSLPISYSPINQGDSPFEALRKSELRGILAELIQQIPEREQLIISLYYYEELTMKEIGHVLGVNESRVSQLHTRAMLRLRGKLQAALKKQSEAAL
ncbi:MAG TPA: sigma-70 family RNA polymerase sigma factor, partial [Acidobacteriota bacterium]|nr:sigma-70 family RNA polymerase sigma factor [Acidobacteriota bacterium]